jgi:uncharacterized protein YcbX
MKKSVSIWDFGHFESFVEEMDKERQYQVKKWGDEFDRKNTPNDWVAYIGKYLGQTVTLPWNPEEFKKQLVKVATLAEAAYAWCERVDGNMPKRHYD